MVKIKTVVSFSFISCSNKIVVTLPEDVAVYVWLIDEHEEGTEIRGIIGPGASIWTAFIFTFSVLGFIAFVALLWGLSLLSLGNSANILWVVPVILVLILGVYTIAMTGQRLSKDQVLHLRNFVEDTLKE